MRGANEGGGDWTGSWGEVSEGRMSEETSRLLRPHSTLWLSSVCFVCVEHPPSMMCNAHTGQRHGVKSAHSMPSLLHSHPIPPSPYPHRQHLVGINLGRRGTCINKGSYLLRGKIKVSFLVKISVFCDLEISWS